MSRLVADDFDNIACLLAPESIDLILTDPPYPRRQFIPCWELLAKWAPVLLKDGGSLISIVPHYIVEDAVSIMKGRLKYRWIHNMDQEAGQHPRMAMGIEVCWKPNLHYVKRAYPHGRGFMRDKVIIPSKEKELHEWQQSEIWADYFIRKLSEPGDTVLDPFCGTGTVPLVATRLKRHFIAVDEDTESIATATRRLADDPSQ